MTLWNRPKNTAQRERTTERTTIRRYLEDFHMYGWTLKNNTRNKKVFLKQCTYLLCNDFFQATSCKGLDETHEKPWDKVNHFKVFYLDCFLHKILHWYFVNFNLFYGRHWFCGKLSYLEMQTRILPWYLDQNCHFWTTINHFPRNILTDIAL